MKQVAWHNNASIENIPAGLRPLIPAVVTAYQQYYGQNLRAVYINGSAVRGEWKPGSDIDVIGFVRGDFAADDAALAQLLEATVKQSRASAIIDPLTITDGARSQPTPRILYRLMILALDGIHIWGEPVDLSQAVPTGPIAFASRLYFDFKSSYERYNAMPFDGSPDMVRRARRLTKMVLRLANGIAVINGAPFSSSYSASLENVKHFAPDFYHDAAACFAVRSKPQLTAADYKMLCLALGELVAYAESRGVTFAPRELTGKNT